MSMTSPSHHNCALRYLQGQEHSCSCVPGVIDGAELLRVLSSKINFPGRVCGLEACTDLGLLLLGEVLHAVAELPCRPVLPR
jgi:hypothetical protein